MYCPICGAVSISKAEPNAPVKDYVCKHCKAQYELKSKRANTNKYSTKVDDGVYRTMIDRITTLDNPSFFFLHYDRYAVNNLIIVHKCFFVPDVIEKRIPLPATARRAGWEVCNILLGKVPEATKLRDHERLNYSRMLACCRSYPIARTRPCKYIYPFD